MSAGFTRSQIEQYILSCEPVRWAYWFTDCKDAEAKQRLREALFDSDGFLRNLSDPHVAASFAEVVLLSEYLAEYVAAEMAARLKD